MALPSLKSNHERVPLVGLMGIQELAKFLDTSPASLRRWEKFGNMPVAIRIGPKGVRKWHKREIAQWLTLLSNGEGRLWSNPILNFTNDAQ